MAGDQLTAVPSASLVASNVYNAGDHAKWLLKEVRR